MSTIPILYLSIASHSYIGGIAGMMKNKRAKDRGRYEVFYILCFLFLSLFTFSILFACYGDKIQGILLPDEGFLPGLPLNPAVLALLAFFVQITFDAVYMVARAKIKGPSVYTPPQYNIPLLLLMGCCEEVSYRGVILFCLMKFEVGYGFALLISSLLYLLNHSHMIADSNMKTYWCVSRFLLGFLLGVSALYGGLIYAIFLHLAYNFYIMLAVPYFSRRMAR